jgi:Ca2+-transporting ATPase
MVGIVGLWDPIRSEVPESIETCRTAGIHVLMITGDHPETAGTIARAAGFPSSEILTGAELQAMDDAELGDRLSKAHVIARAKPDHKLRIVQVLQDRGLVVGMTGDGVNDAPALKRASVGIAMGARGTDVAREAASLVLENDAFGSIVAAIRAGRRVFDNLQRAFGYLVAVHVPIAGVSLVPALLGWSPVMTPIHVVFLELVIDPVCSVVLELEPEPDDIMSRPPRSKSAPLFGRRRFLRSTLLGASVLVGILGVIGLSHAAAAIDTQRSLSFIGLVTGNLALLAVFHYDRGGAKPKGVNPALVPLVASVLLLLLLVLGIPPVREFFRFGPLELGSTVSMVLGATASPALVHGLLRLIGSKAL